jgi:hypothetical protein
MIGSFFRSVRDDNPFCRGKQGAQHVLCQDDLPAELGLFGGIAIESRTMGRKKLDYGTDLEITTPWNS